MNRSAVEEWVDSYESAWRTHGTESLAVLFTREATYRTAPFEEPFRGLAAIRAMWEEGREGPDEAFELEREVIAVEGEVGVVRLEVRYGPPQPQTFRDLWIVRLDGDGRCVAFEEWPFWPPGTEGGFAPGPAVSPPTSG